MNEWWPPACRTRAVPHLGAATLTPSLCLVPDEPRGGRYYARLWLRMRHLLPPDYWFAWFDVPREHRTPRGVGGPPVQDFNGLLMRLQDLTDALHARGVLITVAQAALWACLRPAARARDLAQEIADWHQVDPTGTGWIAAAAGLTPDEYAALLANGPLDGDTLHGLAALRGYRFPHPNLVPTPADEVVATAR